MVKRPNIPERDKKYRVIDKKRRKAAERVKARFGIRFFESEW